METRQATREVFWNISSSGEILFYLISIGVLAVFGYGLYRNFLPIIKILVPPPDSLLSLRCLGRVASVFANRSVAHRHPLAGGMHFLIMWGFVVLGIGTLIVLIEYDLFQKLLKFRHGFWVGGFFLTYELTLDIFGLLFAVGLVVALVRRYLLKPPQIKRGAGDLVLPVWLLLLAITGFFVEGLRLAANAEHLGYSAGWSPVGQLASFLFVGIDEGTLKACHWALWWLHGVLALAWVAYLPFARKATHILSAGLNVLLQGPLSDQLRGRFLFMTRAIWVVITVFFSPSRNLAEHSRYSLGRNEKHAREWSLLRCRWRSNLDRRRT